MKMNMTMRLSLSSLLLFNAYATLQSSYALAQPIALALQGGELGTPGVSEGTQNHDHNKFHPMVKQWLHKLSPCEHVFIVVTLKQDDELQRSPLPEPNMDEPQDVQPDQQSKNHLRITQILQTSELLARRIDLYQKLAGFIRRYGGKIISEFWLINALEIEVPVVALKALAELDYVQYIEPSLTQDIP